MSADSPGLETKFSTERLAQVDSTNEEALRRIRAGETGPLWIVAGQQRSGRGRSGRGWTSPPGNLHATLVYQPQGSQQPLHELGFVAGVSLAEAVSQLIGGEGGAGIALKWPNDLLYQNGKAAGILVESETGTDKNPVVAIGMGVNCGSAPSDTPYPASTLGGTPAEDVNLLFARLLQAMRNWLAIWEQDGFAPIRDAWAKYAMAQGAPITVHAGSERVAGVFAGIDESGALRLDTDQGLRIIHAGDIFPGLAR